MELRGAAPRRIQVSAARRGGRSCRGAYPVVLNAANEVAVKAFLDGRIRFLRIADVIEEVLEVVPGFGMMQSMEAIEAVDGWARAEAERRVGGVPR